MPIEKPCELRKLTRQEFGEISYAVMHHAFQIHSEMGCFFDELIYRNALRQRLGDIARTEARISVQFDGFRHDYFIDLLVEQGAIFELKSVDNLTGAHRSQLINYLLLCGLEHGKLINFGLPSLQHEFVNAYDLPNERRKFLTTFSEWSMFELSFWMQDFLKDVGTGLDVGLYEKAAVHFLGGESNVLHPVEISGLGFQTLKLADPKWGLQVTTLPLTASQSFLRNARRFLAKTNLAGTCWINITKGNLSFQAVKR